MKILTVKGKGKVKLTDRQMSVIMSALAVATVYWNEFADPEVTISKEDILETSYYLLTAYGKSVGISKKEVHEAISKVVDDYKK